MKNIFEQFKNTNHEEHDDMDELETEGWLQQGIILFEENKLSEALVYIQNALETTPNHIPALIYKAKIFEKQNLLEEALKCYDIIISISPKNSEAFHRKGEILDAMENDLGALQYYDKAISLNRNNAEVHFDKAQLLSSLGSDHTEEAAKYYQNAIALESKSVDLIEQNKLEKKEDLEEERQEKNMLKKNNQDVFYNQQTTQHPVMYSPKSGELTIILFVILGFFGAHRFYVGKWFSGLMYMFTGGGFLIGLMYDFICLMRGTFKDSSELPIKMNFFMFLMTLFFGLLFSVSTYFIWQSIPEDYKKKAELESMARNEVALSEAILKNDTNAIKLYQDIIKRQKDNSLSTP